MGLRVPVYGETKTVEHAVFRRKSKSNQAIIVELQPCNLDHGRMPQYNPIKIQNFNVQRTQKDSNAVNHSGCMHKRKARHALLSTLPDRVGLPTEFGFMPNNKRPDAQAPAVDVGDGGRSVLTFATSDAHGLHCLLGRRLPHGPNPTLHTFEPRKEGSTARFRSPDLRKPETFGSCRGPPKPNPEHPNRPIQSIQSMPEDSPEHELVPGTHAMMNICGMTPVGLFSTSWGIVKERNHGSLPSRSLFVCHY